MIRRITGSRLFRSAGIYTAANMAAMAIPFLVMPVLTRCLGTEDYGRISMFAILLGALAPVVGLNFPGALSVRYFDRDRTDIPRYIGNGIILLLLTASVTTLAVWLARPLIGRFLGITGGWPLVAVLICACQVPALILMALWQVQDKPVRYSLYQVLQALANIGLTLWLVAGLGQAWQGRIGAMALTAAGFGLLALLLLRSGGWLSLRWNRQHLRQITAFGWPLIPHTVGALMIAQADRFFIANLVGLGETGVYSVGLQLAMAIEIGASSFNRAYVPWLFARLKDGREEDKRRIVKLTYLYMALIVAAAVALAALAPWFLSFFVGPRFRGASQYILWLGLGFAFNGMYYMVTNYIFYCGRTSLVAAITLSAGLANLPLTYTLVRWNGALGAAQAAALTYLLAFLLTWAAADRAYPMPWDLGKANRLNKHRT